MADRRGRDMQFPGRDREAEMACGGLESPERVERGQAQRWRFKVRFSIYRLHEISIAAMQLKDYNFV
ncbi:hypothetical protein D3C83_266220 [compost metagenome]